MICDRGVIEEAQFFNEHILWDKSTAYIHRQEKEPVDSLTKGHIALGHNVCRGNGQNQVIRRTKYGIDDRIAVANPKLTLLEHIFIGVKGEAFDPRHHIAQCNF